MIMTRTTNNAFRLPAEWESADAVLLAWPHEATDWNYMLESVRRCYTDIAAAIVPHARLVIIAPDVEPARRMLAHLPQERIIYVTCPTNDTWARDFGPLSLCAADGSWLVADYRFNGWGLKFAACEDNCVTPRLKTKGLIGADVECRQNFVLEGGGIESDGKGTLMTTARCQLSPNRNPWMSEDQIKDCLVEAFGAESIIWLRHGYLAGDDTDSHIDTLARFAPHDAIVYVGCDDPDDEHYSELQAMKAELQQAVTASGRSFSLFELPLPDAIYDEDGERLPATYANFLVLRDCVIMPVYGQPMKDELARRIIEVAYEREAVTVDCRPLIRQHGSLHCVTMQMPDQILSI